MGYINDIKDLIRILSEHELPMKFGVELEWLKGSLSPAVPVEDVSVSLLKILFKLDCLSKDLRKGFKSSLLNMHKHNAVEMENGLSACLKIQFSSNETGPDITYHAISFLLEDCPFTRILMSPYFDIIVAVLCNDLQSTRVTPNAGDTKAKQDLLRCQARLAVQIVQYMSEDLTRCISDRDSMSHKRLVSLFQNSIIISQKPEDFSSSVCHLCAVLVGQVINNFTDDCEAAVMMFRIFGQQLHILQEKAGGGILTAFSTTIVPGQSDHVGRQMHLLKGIFSCVRPSPFIVEIGRDDCPTFLHCSLNLICAGLRFFGEHKYHAFEALKLWWINTSKLLKSQQEDLIAKYFNESGQFLKTNLKLLISHWDDPISGVPALSLQIFNMMIQLHLSIASKSDRQKIDALNITDFVKNLIHELVLLSTSVKGKYNFLTVIISKVGTDFLFKQYPDFLDSLVPLLGINHLFPAISKTYSAVVTETMERADDSNKVAIWKAVFESGLLKVLLNDNPVIRVNGLRFWLPVHLKKVPGAYQLLVEMIQNFNGIDVGPSSKLENSLLALIAVAKVARAENLIDMKSMDVEVLHESFSDFSNDVRSEAFTLVCCHSRTSDQISNQELDLVKLYLPYNMNCDSPTFRQNIVFCMGHFFKRLKDSTTAYARRQLKAKALNAENTPTYEELCCENIRFIVDLCLESMHVSFSYQRKKMALDMFSTFLGVFCSDEKNKISPNVAELRKNLFSQKNLMVLVYLFQDSVAEIRDISLEISVKYFPALAAESLAKVRTLSAELCRSPRAQETESAAILYEYMLMHDELESSKSFPDVLDTSSTLAAMLCQNRAILQELSSLNENMRMDMSLYRTNTLAASQKSPVHGWMLSLNRCLQNIRTRHKKTSFNQQNLQCLLKIVNSVKDNTHDVIRHTLVNIFGSGDGSDGAEIGVSADFSEITQRIDRMVLGESENTSPKTRGILLTTDHESILACCWLCLLHGSSLLSTIALLKVDFLKGMEQKDEISLKKICKIFISILMGCRHRGAIEGCYEQFLVTCKALMSSGFDGYKAIPCDILKDTMHMLYNHDGQSGANVTRRSAGIPLIVEAVLVAEISHGSNSLFLATMTNVLEVAKQAATLAPVPTNDNHDFPEVHSIYILKHLFRNTCLGSAVLKYTETVFEIAYRCLSSQLWVVRNAATHLFGAVAGRMLGQQHIDGVHNESLDNSVPSVEFFSNYPNLHDFILEELKLIPCGKMLPKPGLHPVLSVLSKLTFGKDRAAKDCERLAVAVAELLGCPVLQVRRLAAEALRGLMSENQALEIAQTYLDDLPIERAIKVLDQNLLHGRLIFILLMVKKGCRTSGLAERCVSILWNKCWLWNLKSNAHAIISSTCMEILLECVSKVSTEVFKGVANTLECMVSDAVRYEYDGSIAHEAGMNILLQHMVKLALDISDQQQVIAKFRTLMSSKSRIVRLAALDWVDGAMTDGMVLGEISTVISDFLFMGSSYGENTLCSSLVSKCLECVTVTACNFGSFGNSMNMYQVVHNALTSHLSPLSLRCSALKMLSAIAVDCMGMRGDAKTILDNGFSHKVAAVWIQHIVSRTSHMEASEPLRLSASVSLELAGTEVLQFLLNCQDTILGDCVSVSNLVGDLSCATISLLHDEQPGIRLHACTFVSRLCSYSSHCRKKVWQQYIATQRFLLYILEKCVQNYSVLETMFGACFMNVNVKDNKSDQDALFDKEPFNLYEEPGMIAQIAAETFMAVLHSRKQQSELKQFLNRKLCESVGKCKAIKEKGMKHNYVAVVCTSHGIRLLLELLDCTEMAVSETELSGALNFLKDCPSQEAHQATSGVLAKTKICSTATP